MDIYEGIHSEVVSFNRFDKYSDISTTYLGRVDKENQHKLKAEESFPISEPGYTLGRLLDGKNVNYYWTWVQVNPSCQNHFICDVSCSTLYQDWLQEHKGYKLEMVNVLVCHLL